MAVFAGGSLPERPGLDNNAYRDFEVDGFGTPCGSQTGTSNAPESEAGSRCGTELSSVNNSTASAEEYLPLLEAWPLHALPRGRGTFSLRMRRASTRQPFGISFDASGLIDGFGDERPPSITVREDLPHLGIICGDSVLSINGYEPSSVSECRSFLQEATSIRLVMRRRPGIALEASTHRHARECPEPTLLLSVTRAVVVFPKKGEFRLCMQRTSLSQRFGLHFREAFASRTRKLVGVIVTQNLPHLALRKSDRLLEINGVRNPGRVECEEILQKDTTLTLVFCRELRSGTGLRRKNLIHYLQPLGDVPEPDTSEEEVSLREANDQSWVEECTISACVAIGCAEAEAVQRPLSHEREAEQTVFRRAVPAKSAWNKEVSNKDDFVAHPVCRPQHTDTSPPGHGRQTWSLWAVPG